MKHVSGIFMGRYHYGMFSFQLCMWLKHVSGVDGTLSSYRTNSSSLANDIKVFIAKHLAL